MVESSWDFREKMARTWGMGVQNGRKCHPVQGWKDLTLGGPEKDHM